LKLPNGIPCYNTFARVLEALDPVLFSQCIINHLNESGLLEAGGQIAIDGKALRGSRSGASSHIHAVSAWACKSGLTLAQEFDFAAHQLGDRKLSGEKWSYAESEERGHGRVEKRQTVVCHSIDWMQSSIRDEWKDLNCVVMVSRHCELGGGKTRSEISYFMSSLKGVKAEEMQRYIRGHWGIENSCHWVLDTLFREDHNQTRAKNAAKNLSTLRRIALNALKQASDNSTRKRPKSLTKKQLQAAHDDTYLEEVLSLM